MSEPRASGTMTLMELCALEVLQSLIESPYYFGGKEASSQMTSEIIVNEAIDITNLMLKKISEIEKVEKEQ